MTSMAVLEIDTQFDFLLSAFKAVVHLRAYLIVDEEREREIG